MKLLSVNVSLIKEVAYHGEQVATGIFKQPINGRIWLSTLNLAGDQQADLRVHGGVDKAVYLYPFEHYATWQQELNRDALPFGQFGENFTVQGIVEDEVHIGDVFQAGTAVFQITQPRVPCYKLGIRLNMPQFPKLFMASGRTGYYGRVLQEGWVSPNDPIQRLQDHSNSMTVKDIFRLMYHDMHNYPALAKALQIEALASGWRDAFAARLKEKVMGG